MPPILWHRSCGPTSSAAGGFVACGIGFGLPSSLMSLARPPVKSASGQLPESPRVADHTRTKTTRVVKTCRAPTSAVPKCSLRRQPTLPCMKWTVRRMLAPNKTRESHLSYANSDPASERAMLDSGRRSPVPCCWASWSELYFRSCLRLPGPAG
jgi:hypothetical protein